MARDYKREYKIRSQKSKDDRQHRRVARRLMAKKLGIKKIKGKDVDHKNGNPRDNRLSNLRIRSKSSNRKTNYA
mgnify:FL=1